MKLFENGVGRPSNEIKKKRRIFIGIIFSMIVIFFIIGYFAIFEVNVLDLKGELSNGYYSELYSQESITVELKSDINVKKSGKSKDVSFELSNFGKKVGQVKVSLCSSLEICKGTDAYTKTKNNGGSSVAIKNKSSKVKKSLKIKDSSDSAKVYYLKVSTYDSKNNHLRDAIYEISNKKKKNSTSWVYEWFVVYGKNQVDVGSALPVIDGGIKCPSTVKVGDEFYCMAMIEGDYVTEFSTTSKDIEQNYPDVEYGKVYGKFKFSKIGNKKIKACDNGKCISTVVKVVSATSQPALELYCRSHYSQYLDTANTIYCDTLIADTKITYLDGVKDGMDNTYVNIDNDFLYLDRTCSPSTFKMYVSPTYGGLFEFSAKKDGYMSTVITTEFKYIAVPNVIDMDVKTAKKILLKSNLKVDSKYKCSTYKTSDKSKDGLVSKTSIKAGEQVKSGTKVGICQYKYSD